MSSLLRPALLLALVSLAVASTLPACSQQGEGERCDLAKNGDADCDSGLVCIAKTRLRDKLADRCCDPIPGASSDSRCDRDMPTTDTGGSGGSAGSTPTGGAPDSAGNGGAPTSSGGSGGSGGSAGSIPTGGAPESAGNGGQSDGGAMSMDPGAGRGGA